MKAAFMKSIENKNLALILGFLSCLGPLSIDMYLPAMPVLAIDLNTSESSIQFTLMSYFIGFGISQMFYGPLSDQIGRKKPLYIGLAIYLLGAVGCIFSPSIEWLTTARFIQGIGGAVLMIVPRAIIRDTQTGIAAARLMGVIMMVVSLSPMLAPLAGSGILLSGNWRMIFIVLFALAIMSVMIIFLSLPETLKPENRTIFSFKNFLKGISFLLKDSYFIGMTLIGGFGMASLFVFIASASFVYTQEFQLTPLEFGLAFGFNGIGFFIATKSSSAVSQKVGLERMLSLTLIAFLSLSLLLLGLSWMGYGTLPIVIGLLFLIYGCLGLILPSTMVLSLEKHGKMAGLASSLGGTIQMFAGGTMIALTTPFFNGKTVPMVSAIAVCSLLVFVFSLMTHSQPPRIAVRNL